MRQLAAVVVVLLVGFVLAGCGPEGGVVEPPPEVSGQGVAHELGSSPAQTALHWWESLRARDAEAAVAGLIPAARRTVDMPLLRKSLRGPFGHFAEESEATVLYTERRAARATVYMRVDLGGLLGPTRLKSAAIMLALPFVARDGAWLIENSAWLRGQAASFIAIEQFNRRLREEARKQAREEEGDE
jgi:hypothetical protein